MFQQELLCDKSLMGKFTFNFNMMFTKGFMKSAVQFIKLGYLREEDKEMKESFYTIGEKDSIDQINAQKQINDQNDIINDVMKNMSMEDKLNLQNKLTKVVDKDYKTKIANKSMTKQDYDNLVDKRAQVMKEYSESLKITSNTTKDKGKEKAGTSSP